MNEESGLSRYDEVILAVFTRLIGMYGSAATRLAFDKELLDVIGNEINIKNIPDILYSYRSGRRTFPREIRESGDWVIVGEGKGHYAFVKLDVPAELVLPLDLELTAILDATPEVVARYAKGMSRVSWSRSGTIA